MQTVAVALSYAINVIILLIVVRAVMSFVPNIDPRHPVVRTLDQIVDPILMPIQRIVPPVGGLDFSPMIAIFALQALAGLLNSFLR
jgi:YggT family protein